MSNHPGKIGHHQETPRNSSNHALGHQCSFSGPIGLWLKYPYFNHRSPTYVRTPRNNQASTGKSRKNPGILQTIHWVTNVHSVGFSGSIGLWLSYHKLPIWECLQNGVPQTFFFHLKKSLGHSCGHPYFETSPYVFHRSPTHVRTHRNNQAPPANTQGFFKPFIGSPMFTQWVHWSLAKLP